LLARRFRECVGVLGDSMPGMDPPWAIYCPAITMTPVLLARR
jgi:hypothetical protein